MHPSKRDVPTGCAMRCRVGTRWAKNLRSTRRRSGPPDDDRDVSEQSAVDEDGLLALYDRALPHVYGYLLSRCGRRSLAEDLTAETFLAAVAAVRRPERPRLDTGWLVGVARHKLVDHWRRQARDDRSMRIIATGVPLAEDPWAERLDALRAQETLAGLGAHHRSVLTLRYLDDLPVADVAAMLGRSLHATEALLVRARAAFRRAYDDAAEEGDRD